MNNLNEQVNRMRTLMGISPKETWVLNEGVYKKRGMPCPLSKEEEDAIYDREQKAKDNFLRLRDGLGKKYNLTNSHGNNITPFIKDPKDKEEFLRVYKENRAASKAHKEYEEVYLNNRAERFDDIFTTEDEYNSLVRLYELSPEHFAKPYKSIKDDKGCVTGYDVEQVEGETIGLSSKDVISGVKKQFNATPELFDQIEDVVKMIHQNGEAHGDLHSGNIMITDGGNNFKIIDPIGYPSDYHNLTIAIKRDLDTLSSLRSALKIGVASTKKEFCNNCYGKAITVSYLKNHIFGDTLLSVLKEKGLKIGLVELTKEAGEDIASMSQLAGDLIICYFKCEQGIDIKNVSLGDILKMMGEFEDSMGVWWWPNIIKYIKKWWDDDKNIKESIGKRCD